MKTRKVVYNISYYHILTFSQEYRFALAPFFKLPNLQYGFENQDTFEEGLRLIFKNDHFAAFLAKMDYLASHFWVRVFM
ncbi:MAG: hypothetical protein RLN88_11470 [Ekhidna sp.]|uniref:hypothetical protein n=1 Tax=Ekhidna sp. TaxID=2608089 RepID=UPI0032EC07DA